jgi:hypothetical protein
VVLQFVTSTCTSNDEEAWTAMVKHSCSILKYTLYSHSFKLGSEELLCDASRNVDVENIEFGRPFTSALLELRALAHPVVPTPFPSISYVEATCLPSDTVVDPMPESWRFQSHLNMYIEVGMQHGRGALFQNHAPTGVMVQG